MPESSEISSEARRTKAKYKNARRSANYRERLKALTMELDGHNVWCEDPLKIVPRSSGGPGGLMKLKEEVLSAERLLSTEETLYWVVRPSTPGAMDPTGPGSSGKYSWDKLQSLAQSDQTRPIRPIGWYMHNQRPRLGLDIRQEEDRLLAETSRLSNVSSERIPEQTSQIHQAGSNRVHRAITTGRTIQQQPKHETETATAGVAVSAEGSLNEYSAEEGDDSAGDMDDEESGEEEIAPQSQVSQGGIGTHVTEEQREKAMRIALARWRPA